MFTGPYPIIHAVKSGDTLSQIAQTSHEKLSELEHDNTQLAPDYDLIFPGQKVYIGETAPASDAATGPTYVKETYKPRHSYKAQPTVSVHYVSTSGTLSCSGLETLWVEAGGDPAHKFMAAEIAMAESGGNQYAVSPTDDYGYWQINRAAHGSMASFNPLTNARAAIEISGNGTDWEPWTTYQTGAYEGKC